MKKSESWQINTNRPHMKTMRKGILRTGIQTRTHNKTNQRSRNEQVNWTEMQCECDATRQNLRTAEEQQQQQKQERRKKRRRRKEERKKLAT